MLEGLQKRESGRSGIYRDPDSDPRVLKEIAERQLMAERLDRETSGSITDFTDALVTLVGEPGYEAAVEARVAVMSQYFLASDGDLWSTYERPDHRKRLSDFVVKVEAAAAARGYAIARRPVIGTLLTGNINAEARPGPSGEGHLVVFDSGLFIFAASLTGIAVQAIDARFGEGHASLTFRSPEGIAEHVARRPGILVQFADLAFSHAVLGSCLFTDPIHLPPEYHELGQSLTDVVLTFALAHEYGHVILGHTDLPRLRQTREKSHELELAADRVGFELASAAAGVGDWAWLGANLFLNGVDVLTRAASMFRTGHDEVTSSDTHPSPHDRAAHLAALAPGLVSATMAPHIERMSAAIDVALARFWQFSRPSFEAGYAAGYPPAGYRPTSEYEKQAALHAFMAVRFQGSSAPP